MDFKWLLIRIKWWIEDYWLTILGFTVLLVVLCVFFLCLFMYNDKYEMKVELVKTKDVKQELRDKNKDSKEKYSLSKDLVIDKTYSDRVEIYKREDMVKRIDEDFNYYNPKTIKGFNKNTETFKGSVDLYKKYSGFNKDCSNTEGDSVVNVSKYKGDNCVIKVVNKVPNIVHNKLSGTELKDLENITYSSLDYVYTQRKVIKDMDDTLKLIGNKEHKETLGNVVKTLKALNNMKFQLISSLNGAVSSNESFDDTEAERLIEEYNSDYKIINDLEKDVLKYLDDVDSEIVY